MVYDIDMIRSFYSAYKGKMERVRSVLKRPLTLAEKILYTLIPQHYSLTIFISA